MQLKLLPPAPDARWSRVTRLVAPDVNGSDAKADAQEAARRRRRACVFTSDDFYE
jgi:hypothetical protein